MTKLMTSALIALAILASASASEAKSKSDARYLDPTTIDLRQILSGPPQSPVAAPGGEGDQILAREKAATPAAISRAEKEVDLKPAIFSDVLGAHFAKRAFPAIFSLLKNAEKDLALVSAPAKKLWGRPRPPLQDSRITPLLPLPKSDSYPSSHAARGELWGGILAELFPTCAAQLKDRGTLVGEDRILGGVHFPSDVAAGRVLADTVLTRFEQSTDFARDVAAARTEIAAADAGSASVSARCR